MFAYILNCLDMMSLSLSRQVHAGINRFAVQKNSTSPALSGLTTMFYTEESKPAHNLQQVFTRIYL
jgi:hypothetical protein